MWRTRWLALITALLLAPARANAPLAEGVIRAIDRPNARVVMRHGPIENLGIPPMTMSFRVKDPRALEQLETGTPVRFAADRVGGVFTIVHIERRDVRREAHEN